MKISERLINAQQGHATITRVYGLLKPYLIAGHAFALTVKPETRSTAQNRRLWAMLRDVSEQVNWHGKKLTDEDWKHVFSAALRKQAVVPNLEGTGFVVLGQSTSTMTRAEMTELQDLIEAFGAQHEVRFSAPEYMEEAA
jgi:NinB protein